MKVKICTMLMCASMQMYATGETAVSNASRDAVVNNPNHIDKMTVSMNLLIMINHMEGVYVDDRSFSTARIDHAQQEAWHYRDTSRVILETIMNNADFPPVIFRLLPASILRMPPSRAAELLPGVQYIIEKTFQDLLEANNCKKQIVTATPSQEIIAKAQVYVNIIRSLLEQAPACKFDVRQYKYCSMVFATPSQSEHMLDRRDSHMITENSLETIRSCILEGVFIDDDHGRSHIVDKTNRDVLIIYGILHNYNILLAFAMSNPIDDEEKRILRGYLPIMKYYIQLQFKHYLITLGLNMQIITEVPSDQRMIECQSFLMRYRTNPAFSFDAFDIIADTAVYNAEIANGTRVARSVQMMWRYMKYNLDDTLSVFQNANNSGDLPFLKNQITF